MKYWLDTEFIEDGKTVDLISIGIVAEDGREYYRQAAWTDHDKANPWVRENVLPHLTPCPAGRPPLYAHQLDREPALNLNPYPVCSAQRHPECPYRTRSNMADEVRRFVDAQLYGKPEFWGYYADYDWVAVCQLFGRMMDLPRGWPMYCRDIKQMCDLLGNPKLPPEGKDEHHALADARWNREAYNFLKQYARERAGEILLSPITG